MRKNPNPKIVSQITRNLNYIKRYIADLSGFPHEEELYRRDLSKEKILYLIKELEYLLKNIEEITYVTSGGFANVYKILSVKKIMINRQILQPGQYILKLYFSNFPFEEYPTEQCIRNLIKYSKVGIIPEVYFSSKLFVLMEYINGIPMHELQKWYEARLLGFNYYPDIPKNILTNLVTKKNNIIRKFLSLFPNDTKLDIYKIDNWW